MHLGATIVIDLGKTLSKVTLWDAEGRCLDRQTRPNAAVRGDGPWVLDLAGIAEWLMVTLAKFADHPVESIIPVSHGAAIVGLRNSELAFPPLDYEWPIPADSLAEYRVGRDAFAVTGSPALPLGLNIGSQLHWLEAQDPSRFAGVTLLPYAQYWAWLLSGVAVSEATSLGCHSDLWDPSTGTFSPMARRRGWAARFAPLVRAGDVIGTLKPEVARLTGLSEQVRIHAGLHDSNAALLAARGFPQLAGCESTVLSTGTWFIAMRTPDGPIDLSALPEDRDCLVNVDAAGRPVPSARFMGGREIETLIELDTRQVDIRPDQPALLAAVPRVLERGAMVLPTLAPGCGPFPNGAFAFANRPEDWFERRAAACLYAALVTERMLGLIGSRERVLVEGRFAKAEVFVRALAALRPDCAVYVANAHNDVSFGALRAIDPSLQPAGELVRVEPLPDDLETYRARWAAEVKAVA